MMKDQIENLNEENKEANFPGIETPDFSKVKDPYLRKFLMALAADELENGTVFMGGPVIVTKESIGGKLEY